MEFKNNAAKRILVAVCIFLIVASAVAGVSAYFITKHTAIQPALAASAELISGGIINADAANALLDNHNKGVTFNLCGQEYKVVVTGSDQITAWATGYVHEMAFNDGSPYNAYKGSDVEAYLVGTYYTTLCDYGGTGSNTNILNSIIVPASATGNGAFDSARLWLPSYNEVKDSGTWGFTANSDRKTALGNESSYAWLRSSFYSDYVLTVAADAGVFSNGYYSNTRGVRPALHLSLSALESLTPKPPIGLYVLNSTTNQFEDENGSYGSNYPASADKITIQFFDKDNNLALSETMSFMSGDSEIFVGDSLNSDEFYRVKILTPTFLRYAVTLSWRGTDKENYISSSSFMICTNADIDIIIDVIAITDDSWLTDYYAP